MGHTDSTSTLAVKKQHCQTHPMRRGLSVPPSPSPFPRKGFRVAYPGKLPFPHLLCKTCGKARKTIL